MRRKPARCEWSAPSQSPSTAPRPPPPPPASSSVPTPQPQSAFRTFPGSGLPKVAAVTLSLRQDPARLLVPSGSFLARVLSVLPRARPSTAGPPPFRPCP